MVDAKTLQVGDYIYNSDNELCKVYLVNGLFTPHATVDNLDKNDGCFEQLTSEEIKPIPLTDEILKTNGFEYFHKNFAALNRESPFQLKMLEWPDENGNGGLWMIGCIITIRYVHELQHAINVCGIEKTIKL